MAKENNGKKKKKMQPSENSRETEQCKNDMARRRTDINP